MTLRRSLSCTLLVCVVVLAHGAPAFAEDAWQLGRQAFEAADYTTALELFESARDAGQSGPAVHYNIGVCQYKLARYSDSKSTFSLIANQYPNMRSLAEYNLGVVDMKLDDTDAAQLHFLTAYELSADDEKLRTLAANMLHSTDTDTEPATYWIGSFGARAGYDDNVALRDDLGLPAGTTTDSPMVDAFASLVGPFRDSSRLRLDAAVYAITYFDVHDFDQNVLSLGAIYDWTLGDWHTKAGIYAGYGTLGGDGFDKTGSASISADRSLGAESQISIRFRYDDIAAANSAFSGIEGNRQRVDARYRWSRQQQRMSLRYSYEINDRRDPGVSPDRHAVRIDYRFDTHAGLGYEAGGQLRSSEYDRLVPGRSEDLLMIYIGIAKKLKSNWEFLGQFQYSDNNSSDPQFSYQRNLITIGLLKTF